MTRVHVICGGQSAEREVSLRSGGAVAEALREAGYDVAVLDTSDSDEQIASCDVVFPVLHGIGGEDGELQARLENMEAKFVGTGSQGSILCLNKAMYRERMIAAGFLMATGDVVTFDTYSQHPIALKPHVLKPIDGGSTIDTYIVRDIGKLDGQKVQDYFSRYSHMLLEELIIGDEVTVGVLDDIALPVIEIIPPSDEEFDYENKYNGKSQELCPPVIVSEAMQHKVQDLTLKLHRLADCRDFSRTDFILTADEQCYLLETNTIPGMTATSLYPKMAATYGLLMSELVDKMVQLALSR